MTLKADKWKPKPDLSETISSRNWRIRRTSDFSKYTSEYFSDSVAPTLRGLNNKEEVASN